MQYIHANSVPVYFIKHSVSCYIYYIHACNLDGWDINNYNKNSVILKWIYNYWQIDSRCLWFLCDFIVYMQVMILITGVSKAFALYKAIEEGISHMWTVSAFQQHPKALFVCDEDATLELRVKTVKYFKGLLHVHNEEVQD